MTTNDLTHAARCIDIYLNNTSEIYERYTLPLIKTAIYNLTGISTSESAIKWTYDNISKCGTLSAAIRSACNLVKKHDNLTPAQSDINAVIANYCAYIIETAQFKINNPVNA